MRTSILIKKAAQKIHNVSDSARCSALANSLITYTLHEKYSFSDMLRLVVVIRKLMSKISRTDYIELPKYNIISYTY